MFLRDIFTKSTLTIKYKCAECDVFVDPSKRSDHVRQHRDYACMANDSTLDFGSLSLLAPNDSLNENPQPSLSDDENLKSTPNPPYPLPLVPSSPTTTPAAPVSQLPATQPSIVSDIVVPPRVLPSSYHLRAHTRSLLKYLLMYESCHQVGLHSQHQMCFLMHRI